MLTIVIQAGGESRRMGQDKALLPFLGQPLIQRVLDRVRPVADEILVTTNQPQAYRFLDVALIPDLLPGRGALGGIYTAIKSANRPLVAIIACDMPFASPDLIRAGRDLLLATHVDIAIPQSSTGMEPFHAVYRRDTCLPAIEAALQAGKWRVDSWFDQVKVETMPAEVVRSYDPQMLCFRNVNTPEELNEAEETARINFNNKGTHHPCP